MRWLLDTCVVFEPAQKQPSSRVLAWLADQPEETLHLSRADARRNPEGSCKAARRRQRKRLGHWLERDLIDRFEGRILAVDAAVADLWGRWQAQAEVRAHPLPTLDSLLAATALVHGLTVVTRNGTDFPAREVEVFDPWT
jgi:predicted nucleic acid-binding protein